MFSEEVFRDMRQIVEDRFPTVAQRFPNAMFVGGELTDQTDYWMQGKEVRFADRNGNIVHVEYFDTDAKYLMRGATSVMTVEMQKFFSIMNGKECSIPVGTVIQWPEWGEL